MKYLSSQKLATDLFQTPFNRCNVIRRIYKKMRLSTTKGSTFATRIVPQREATWGSPDHVWLNAQGIISQFNAEISHLSPILSPGIANDPMLNSRLIIYAPAYYWHNVVGRLITKSVITYNASFIIIERVCINRRSNRSTSKNFSFDRVNVIADDSILGNCRIRKVIDLYRTPEEIRIKM